MRRGEAEGFLFTRLTPEEEEAVRHLERISVKGASRRRTAGDRPRSRTATSACSASPWKARRASLFKKRADEEAIRVFAENLRELLLASPLGQKNMLAIDPGFRTGCKVVLLDGRASCSRNDVIYPEKGARDRGGGGDGRTPW